MQTLSRTLLRCLSALFCLAVLFAARRTDAQIVDETRYAVTDLGTLGGTESVGFAINDAGQVTGAATTASGAFHAFRTAPNAPINAATDDLDPAGAYSYSEGRSINRTGQVCGNLIASDNKYRALFYGASLGTLGGPNARGWSLNNAGYVAGRVGSTPNYAFVWPISMRPNQMKFSSAYGINDSIQVTGYYGVNNDAHLHAFLCQGDANGNIVSFADIHATTTYSDSVARAINQNGDVVGNMYATIGSDRAFLYHSGVMYDLGSLKTDKTTGKCIAYAVNDGLLVVGQAETDSGAMHACLWYENNDGNFVPVDLNSRLPTTSGWTLTTAYGINNTGQIVGGGTNRSGQSRGFLLTPFVWGMRCSVAWADGHNSEEFLVAVEGNTVVFRKDLVFDPVGNAGYPDGGTPLSSIQTITVQRTLPNPTTTFGDDDFVHYGSNRCFLEHPDSTLTPPYRTRSVDLLSYDGTNWNYNRWTIQIINNHRVWVAQPGSRAASQVVFLYAVPRCWSLESPMVGTASVQTWLTNLGQMKDITGNSVLAADVNIPPHLLYGIAWQETPADHHWQQTEKASLMTIVTPDGGVGAMQLTAGTAIFDAYPSNPIPAPPNAPADTLAHLFRLSNDIRYNLQAGARILAQKWNGAAIPHIGTHDPSILEDWYYAVWYYNGPNNNPNDFDLVHLNAPKPYQYTVFAQIASIHRPWLPIKIGKPNVMDIGEDTPPNPLDYTPADVHVDSNFDGVIDAVKAPNIQIAAGTPTWNGGTVTVPLTITNLNSDTPSGVKPWDAKHLKLGAVELRPNRRGVLISVDSRDLGDLAKGATTTAQIKIRNISAGNYTLRVSWTYTDNQNHQEINITIPRRP